MGDLVTDIKSLEIETLKNLKNSKAQNTLRAYQADFRDFTVFCAKNGLNSLPSEPKIVAIYLTHLSTFSKFSTLKRRLASIKVIHRLKGHYIDIKHPIITENLMGIKRKKGVKQTAKKPLLINDLKLIINVIDEENNRDKALILVGFAGGFRRSELVNIDYDVAAPVDVILILIFYDQLDWQTHVRQVFCDLCRHQMPVYLGQMWQ